MTSPDVLWLMLITGSIRLLWLTLQLWAEDVNESAAAYYEACVRPGGEK